MSKLLFDVGNTNIVIALEHKGLITSSFRLSTDTGKTADEYFVTINELIKHFGHKAGDISEFKIASVVPDLEQVLQDICVKYFTNASFKNIKPTDVPIKINLDNPSELGIDRLLNAYEGLKVAKGRGDRFGVIVVDFGTTTTFDVALPEGTYEGGLICAGVGMMASALNTKTAKLPRISFDATENIVGKSTSAAIKSGLYYGNKAMVVGVLEGIKHSYSDYNFYTIATGGLSRAICNQNEVDFLDPDLTLRAISKA
jgi:type III pantothenate kinase